MLTAPLPDVAAWTAHLLDAPIPVMAATADQIALLAAAEERRGDVDAHLLTEPVAADPLMALKLLSTVARARQRRGIDASEGGPETVTAALVMMGIGPFFEAFTATPTAEHVLADMPDALTGLDQVMRRAHRAAQFALGFAIHRADEDAEVLHLAALLHDFADMLLWCHAPTLALQIQQRQHADPTLRSASIQRELLHVELPQLQQALMRAWSLPDLLVRISDDAHAHHPQVRNVMLAIRLARHTQAGWDNPALPDDLTDIAELLNLSVTASTELVRNIDQ